MKIDKQLNLIVNVENDEGQILHVHSMPLLRATFEQYWKILSQTFTAITAQGLGPIAGPRVASMLLKEIAVNLEQWEGENGVRNGLMAEVRRLTNVLLPTESGWQNIPFEDAIKDQLLSADDVSEVENLIVFFIVNSALHLRRDRKEFIENGTQLCGASTTLLSVTEYRDSLTISTDTETTGPEPIADKSAVLPNQSSVAY